jgi:hypothetical protein
VGVSMMPEKSTPNTEWMLLGEMWTDLVETDPKLAQVLGKIPLAERLALIPKRVINWAAKGFSLEYPWM